MFDLRQLIELKNKNLITKTEKYTSTVNGDVMVKFVVKQYDTMTGLQIQDGFLELSLTELRARKQVVKVELDQINAVLTEIKEALN